MGFLFGPAPIRRTLPYLQNCKLLFRDRVKVMEVHYNMYWINYRHNKSHVPFPQHDSHVGMREFYFWNIPQIQYVNPKVQIVRFLEMTPTPFIRCWLSNGTDVTFDCDSQNKEQIVDRLVRVLGKTEQMIKYEQATNVLQASEDNRAIFGVDRERFCICEVPGQCPCTGVVKLPKTLRGKYTNFLKDDLLKEEREFVEGGTDKQLEDYEPPFISKLRFFG